MHPIHRPRNLAAALLSALLLGACAGTGGAPRAPDAPGFGPLGGFRPMPSSGPTERADEGDKRGTLDDTYAQMKTRAVARETARETTPQALYYTERDEERIRALAGGRVVTVRFAAGSARFAPFVQERVRILSLLPFAGAIHVRGHTDGTGSLARNARVALARAEAAKRYLVARGVPPHMIAIGYRATGNYTGDVATAAGRAASRRADIEFVPPVDADRGEWYAMTGYPCPWRQPACNGGAL